MNIFGYVLTGLFLIILLLFVIQLLAGILFDTKIGRKFVYSVGYRSKARLNQFVFYKNDKYVKQEIIRLFHTMMLDYIALHKNEKLDTIEKFFPIWFDWFRTNYLKKIKSDSKIYRNYYRLRLISLREVRRIYNERLDFDKNIASVDQ